MHIFEIGKAGPIYSIEWSPVIDEFCCVYGCMFEINSFKHFRYFSHFRYAIKSNNI